MNRLLRFGVILLTLLSLLVPAQSVMAADRALRIAPEELVLEQIGKVSVVEVRAESVEGLYAVELKLSFDPSLVEVVTADGVSATKVEVGELLASGSKFEGANQVNNAAGTIHFLYTLLGQQASDKSGDGVLIRFHLKVKALGNGAITIEKGDLVEKSSENELVSVQSVLHHGKLRTAAPPNQPGPDNPSGDGSGSPTGQPTAPETPPGAAYVLSSDDLTVMSSSDVESGNVVNRTLVSLSSAAMRTAISAAASAGCAMRVELPEYAQDASAARQEVSLQLPSGELSDLAQVGLDLVGPAGTLVQVPGALLQQLAASGQAFSFTSASVGLPEANDLLQKDGKALAAEEIEANLSGPTALRFRAPAGADLAALRIRVIHSDGSVEDTIPTVRADGDVQYLEIVVNRFSTFIVYQPADTTGQPAGRPMSVVLTVGSLAAVVNDADHQLPFAPYVASASGRTMVPVRFVSEALGAEVTWEPTTKTVRIVDGPSTIVLTIGSNLVTINGIPQRLDAPATLKPGATYVPLRMVSEALGAGVTYDAANKRILIAR